MKQVDQRLLASIMKWTQVLLLEQKNALFVDRKDITEVSVHISNLMISVWFVQCNFNYVCPCNFNYVCPCNFNYVCPCNFNFVCPCNFNYVCPCNFDYVCQCHFN